MGVTAWVLSIYSMLLHTAEERESLAAVSGIRNGVALCLVLYQRLPAPHVFLLFPWAMF